jgi:hypothetical protein
MITLRPQGDDIEKILWYGQNRISFSPDGKLIAATYGPRSGTGGAGRIVVWNLETARELARFDGKDDVAFARDGRLAYGSADAKVSFFHNGTQQHVSLDSLPGREWYESARRVAFAPGGRLAVGISRCLAIVDGKQVAPLARKHQADIQALAWSADEQHLYSLDLSYLRVWSLARREPLKRIPLAGQQHLLIASDGKSLLSCGQKLLRLPLAKALPGKAGIVLREACFAVAQHPDGRLAVATGKELRLDGKPIGESDRDTSALAFSPDGKLLAVMARATLTLHAL